MMYNDDDEDGGWLDFVVRVCIAAVLIRMLPWSDGHA
jgi:hypothetical protein